MFKFMCLLACAVAAASASSYGRESYGKLGGYVYQVQPAATVKAIVPVDGYGGHRGYGNRGYGHGYHRTVEVPVETVYTNPKSYGYGPPRVDEKSLALAKLSLAAPSAGRPLVWREPYQYATVENHKSYGYGRRDYGYGHEGYGRRSYGHEGYGKSNYGHDNYGRRSYGHEGYGRRSYGHEGYGRRSYGNEGYGRRSYGQRYGDEATAGSAAAAASSVNDKPSYRKGSY